MSGRGKYQASVRTWTERIIFVDADGFDDAESKAKAEALNLLGGYEPEVLWMMEVADDWPVDRADD